MGPQALDMAPKLDVTVNGHDLANKSSLRGQVKSVLGLNDPSKGRHGSVYIGSQYWNYPNYPLAVLQGAYIHEYGNILAYKYRHGDEMKFGDKSGVGRVKDKDTGANFQECVAPWSIKY